MRIGKIQVATSDDLHKMHDTAVGILERVGMRVTDAETLARLEAYGAKVSRADGVVRMPAKTVEKAVQAVRRATDRGESENEKPAEGLGVSLGDGCFFLYDFPTRSRRKATKDDFITTVRFADAVPEVTSFAAPIEIGGIPLPMMVLEMQALALIHSSKPSGVENNIPEQLPFIAQLRRVVSDYREIETGVSAGLGVTSPLVWGDRACRLYLTGKQLGWSGGGCYTMAIAGINAPATVEGCATQAAAEIMGAWTCLMAVDERGPLGTLVLTGTADMRTGKACWSSPGAIRQNSLAIAMFNEVLDVPVGHHWTWYTDAVQPGYQCALDHLMKILSMAPQGGRPAFHLGDLDGASVFSLEQAVLDLDVARACWELCKPACFDEEMMAVAEIERIGLQQGKTHMDTDFTLSHWRDTLWSPEVIPHPYWKGGLTAASEADVLADAHTRWQTTVAEHEPYQAPAGMVVAIEDVLARARDTLL